MPRKPEPHRFRAFVHVAAGAEIQILAMVDDGEIESARQFHGPPHHARIHHRAAVVRNRHDPGFAHGTDRGEFLAVTAFGDRADGEHVDAGDFARALHDVAGHRGAVVDRRVFGMQQMVVKPPAAAARAPVSMVSACSMPGSRRCTCMSMKPGATMQPGASKNAAHRCRSDRFRRLRFGRRESERRRGRRPPMPDR